MRLWGAATPRTFRPIWAACELELEFEHLPLGSRTGETQTEEFTALNASQKIPVLEDGDFVLRESGAIVNYLGSRYGNLVPTDVEQRARYDSWSCFVLMELDAHTLYIVRKHRDLASIYGEAPKAIDAAYEGFDRMIRVPAREFEDGRPYLLGEEFSGADILLGSCLSWADAYDAPLPESLRPYDERLRTRPAFQRAFDLNYETRPEISPFKS
ncbi:MAG: glutathione S-transferase family protein [Acidobacteriota bacterium]